MALSDAKVRNAKPQAKPYKITDGEGMFLLVTPCSCRVVCITHLVSQRVGA